MASKRKANDSDVPAEKSKRRHDDTTGEETILSDGDNMNIPCMCRCIVNSRHFQDMIRRLFREELTAAQHQSPRLTPNLCGGTSEAKQFLLEFSNKLKEEYYTQNKILAERDAPIQILLLDVRSRTIVTEGPMSSSEIEICVLPGDFGSDDDQDQINWGSEKFNANIIVRPREGKRALLKGRTRITLKDGVAFIGNIEFTDISKWVRTGTFRLAAKSRGANVKEAISQPFIVKDKRGESIMKHVQPTLDSDVWRLRHIAKGKKFHKQLSYDGIETVKDFLRLLTTNPSSLKEKFGNISSNKWEAIIKNARACVIDDNVHYIYHSAERRLCFVFNSIYEVVKVSFDDGLAYRSPETFTLAEKRLVEAAKKEAYQNDGDFVLCPVDLDLLGTLQVGQSSNGIPPDGGTPQQFDLSSTQQGQVFDYWGELQYSPSPFLEDLILPTSLEQSLVLEADSSCSLQSLLHSDGPLPSTNGRRKSKTVWTKIRAYLKWLVIRRSVCR